MKKNQILLKTSFLYFILILFAFNSNAQQNAVTGEVTYESGEPVPGVTVIIKGSAQGTITDMNGNYSIAAKMGDILLFSFVGMSSQEIEIRNQTTLNVIMLPDVIGMEELIVIGYGSVKKSNLTGAVTSIGEEVFDIQPVTTIEEGMQGRLSGVQILQSSGQPGVGSSIRIRGVASLSSSSEPLYVIDGVPQFNSEVREANGLSNINPNNISSIEVLKDAASTAIYGSRAANGIILITTKRGKTGKPVMTYSNSFGLQTVRNKLDLMTGQQYFDYVNDYYDNSVTDGDVTATERDEAIAAFDETGINNIDWQDEMYRSALRQSHNLSISGGSDKNRYFISANYLNQEGVVQSSRFERYSLRINVDNEVTDRITLSSKISVSRSLQDRFVGNDGTNVMVGGKSGIGSILNMEPTSGTTDADGNPVNPQPYPFSGVENVNPLSYLDGTDKRTAYRMQGVLEGKIKITDGLTNTVRLGATYDPSKTDFFLPSTVGINGQTVGLNTQNNLSVLAEDFLTYDKQINDAIRINVIAGISYQKDISENLTIEGVGLPSDLLQYNALQALTTMAPPITNNIDQILNSAFARTNFTIKDRYLLSASIRRDGASQFADGNKYAIFPAISGAWRISEEAFLANSSVSNLKLRASWGQSGNQAIKPYQSLTIGNSVNTPTGSGTGLNSGLAPNLPNPHLTWETSTQLDFGLDFGFSNQKYRFSIDWYQKNTEDLLAYVLLPPSAGFSQILANLGEIKNTGIEVSASMNIPVTRDLMFVIDANISKNENIVVKTNNGKDIITGTGSNDRTGTSLIVREGESISSFFLIHYLGNDDDGVPMYEDINNDDIIDGLDKQILGSSLPDFVYGLNMSANYKKFSFTMNWQGVAGGSIYNSRNAISPSVGTNRRANIYDFFPRPSIAVQNELRGPSDMLLEDASYLRLKNLRLNYSLSTASISFLSGLDLYVSAQNLLTFTKYSGYDPEVNSFSGGDLRQGIDLTAYPSVRTLTFGMNVTF